MRIRLSVTGRAQRRYRGQKTIRLQTPDSRGAEPGRARIMPPGDLVRHMRSIDSACRARRLGCGPRLCRVQFPTEA